MSAIVTLDSIERNLYRFGGSFLIAFGTVSCVLNVMVFTKSSLRKNPCALCLTGINIVNFLSLYLVLLPAVLVRGYRIDFSWKDLLICRFQFYIALVLACTQSSYIVLASIDRTLITSIDAHIRRISTQRLMMLNMFIIALFWLVCHIHALIHTQVLHIAPHSYVCFRSPGIYTKIMNYYSLLINGILPPLLMALFGLWTLKNVRAIRSMSNTARARHRTAYAVGRRYILHSKDHQLVRMLLLDIISFAICKCPSALVLMYEQCTQHIEKTPERQAIELSILLITYFLYYIENGISFYTNIFISKTFRREIRDTLRIHLLL
ncbi:unnamed protein product [Adineta ricciae]|uniref:G-protein coupled receptors family 1 profile domain-containing protein n=1 Tax=Adineta ricciae TaxID=249248 RepID=A0A814QLQ7_ADIRI|nr:unnamed protein product [Adineta ricciae]